MSKSDYIYERSPVLAQHAIATAFGVKQRVLRHGGGFQRYCDELDRGQWLTDVALREVQGAKLRAMVAFCAEEVPFYRELFHRLGIVPAQIVGPSDLCHLPVLEKETVRASPERFRPRRQRGRVMQQSTGGTTGTPLRYWVTPSAVQYNYAAYEVRFRNWAGVRFGDRMASVNGRRIVPINRIKPPFWRYNLAFNQLYLSAYHMTEENLPAYIRQLERYRPEVLVGYVSSIHLLATYVNRHRLEGVVHPRAVLVSSETLFPWMRADIEKAFGCKAYDGYGLGELAAFITECRHGGMHTSPEYGVVEGIDIGGERHLVGTGLFNLAMPLLRYDTGDVIQCADANDRCPCGRQLPLVKQVVGRADDYVVTPDGRSVGPAALSLAFQSVAGIIESQIRQEDPASVLVSIVVGDGYDSEDQEHLNQELRQRLGEHLRIEYARVKSIERSVSGKRRLVDSRVGRRNGGDG